jgi:F-box protein 21
MRFVRQQHLKKEWQDFLALDLENQLLEMGAVLVAQWCQPMVEVTYSDIAAKLDKIAEDVKTKLRMEHENHPIFSAAPEKLKSWRNRNISDNQWKPFESQQIISAMCCVLFQDMGFHGNNEMYYSAVNCYINKVWIYIIKLFHNYSRFGRAFLLNIFL